MKRPPAVGRDVVDVDVLVHVHHELALGVHLGFVTEYLIKLNK